MSENKEIMMIKQLPILTEKFKELSEEIKTKVENALSLEINEDNYKEIKKIRADFNKEFKELEAKRIDIKNKVNQPYQEFEENYKEYVKLYYETAEKRLKKGIEDIESKLKSDKLKEVFEYYEEYKSTLNLPFDVKFEKMNLSINMSTSEKKYKEECKQFLDNIISDIELIETQKYKEEILESYENSLNVSESITKITNKYKEFEEMKKREEQRKEEERKAREKKEIEEKARKEEREKIEEERKKQQEEEEKKKAEIMAKIEEEKPKEEINKPVEIIKKDEEVKEQIYTVSFKIIGTAEEIKSVKNFITERGIRYE